MKSKILILFVLSALVGNAHAAGITIGDVGADGLLPIANSDSSIAIGSGTLDWYPAANANGYHDIAIGTFSENAGGNNVTLIGFSARNPLGFDNVTGLGAYATLNGQNATALGYSATAGENAVVVGSGEGLVEATLIGSGYANIDATGVGFRVNASAEGSTVLGAFASNEVNAVNSISLGSYSLATESMTASFGKVGFERRLVNVDAGINGTDAVNFNQLNAVKSTADAALAAATLAASNTGTSTPGPQGIHGETGPQGIQGVKGDTGAQGVAGLNGSPADVSTNSDFLALKAKTAGVSTGANGVVSIGSNAIQMISTPTQDRITTDGNTVDGNLHLGGTAVDNTGAVIPNKTVNVVIDANLSMAGNKITNVANGTAVGDAANFGQVQQVQAVADNALTTANNAVQEIGVVRTELRNIAKKAYGGSALAMAMNSPAPDSDHKVSVTLGTAMFNGEGALAGAVQIKDLIKGGTLGLGFGATTARDVGVKASMTWQWNPTFGKAGS